jgi:hypothetical protein
MKLGRRSSVGLAAKGVALVALGLGGVVSFPGVSFAGDSVGFYFGADGLGTYWRLHSSSRIRTFPLIP